VRNSAAGILPAVATVVNCKLQTYATETLHLFSLLIQDDRHRIRSTLLMTSLNHSHSHRHRISCWVRHRRRDWQICRRPAGWQPPVRRQCTAHKKSPSHHLV